MIFIVSPIVDSVTVPSSSFPIASDEIQLILQYISASSNAHDQVMPCSFEFMSLTLIRCRFRGGRTLDSEARPWECQLHRDVVREWYFGAGQV